MIVSGTGITDGIVSCIVSLTCSRHRLQKTCIGDGWATRLIRASFLMVAMWVVHGFSNVVSCDGSNFVSYLLASRPAGSELVWKWRSGESHRISRLWDATWTNSIIFFSERICMGHCVFHLCYFTRSKMQKKRKGQPWQYQSKSPFDASLCISIVNGRSGIAFLT